MDARMFEGERKRNEKMMQQKLKIPTNRVPLPRDLNLNKNKIILNLIT